MKGKKIIIFMWVFVLSFFCLGVNSFAEDYQSSLRQAEIEIANDPTNQAKYVEYANVENKYGGEKVTVFIDGLKVDTAVAGKEGYAKPELIYNMPYIPLSGLIEENLSKITDSSIKYNKGSESNSSVVEFSFRDKKFELRGDGESIEYIYKMPGGTKMTLTNKIIGKNWRWFAPVDFINGNLSTSAKTKYSWSSTNYAAVQIIVDANSTDVGKPYFKVNGSTINGSSYNSNNGAFTLYGYCDSGSTIYYTTDGTIPTRDSKTFSSTLSINQNMTFVARAYKNGKWSPMKIIYITVDNTTKPGAPQVGDPKPGTYYNPINVYFASTSGTEIYYTTNGYDPVKGEWHTNLYNNYIYINSTTTIKAVAYRGNLKSDVVSFTYYIEQAQNYKPEQPSFSTSGSNPVYVSISSNNSDEIRYTLDRSEPTRYSLRYTGPIAIYDSTYITAKAFRGDNESYSRTEYIQATPAYTPSKPSYTINGDNPKYVTIYCNNGEEIRYTTNGNEPTQDSRLYSGPIAIYETTTIKAKAFKNGVGSSTLQIYVTATQKFRAPQADTPGGTYNGMIFIKLYSPDGGDIYFTGDNSTPTQNSTKYLGGDILIDKNTTLRAKAFKNGQESEEMKETYNIPNKPQKPSISPNGGSFDQPVYVEIYSPNGGTIVYTTDGSNPLLDEGTAKTYKGRLYIDKSMTLKARVYTYYSSTMKNRSEVVSADFNINGSGIILDQPTASPNGGTFRDRVDVTLYNNCGGRIYYTLNGRDPKTESEDGSYVSYVSSGSQIRIDKDCTLKARSYKNGDWSSMLSVNYYINDDNDNDRPSTPRVKVTELDDDEYKITFYSDDDEKIYYTLNNKDPKTEKEAGRTVKYVYDGDSIEVYDDEFTIKARAYDDYDDEWSDLLVKDVNGDDDDNDGLDAPDVDIDELDDGEYEVTFYSRYDGRIYYTLNNKDPKTEKEAGKSVKYVYDEDSIIVDDDDFTIKARVYDPKKEEWSSLLIRDVNDDDNGDVPKPSFSRESGTYSKAFDLKVYCEDEDAKIYYTLNDKDPKDEKDDYVKDGGIIEIEEDCIVKARAYRNGKWSRLVAEEYEVGSGLKAPTLSKKAGSYSGAITVRIDCEEEDAKLYYTLNGEDPKNEKDDYVKDGETVRIDKSRTLKVRAYYKNEWSSLVTAKYTITSKNNDDYVPPYAMEELDEYAKDLLSQAWARYNAKRYDEAISILNELLSEYDDCDEAIVLKANSYVNKKQTSTAKKLLKDFIATYQYPLASNRYAELCIEGGQYAEAKNVITRVLPEYYDQHYLYKTLTYANNKLGFKDIKVFIYGEEVNFAAYDNVKPINEHGTVLVPIRAFAEAFGATVDWDEYTRTATVDYEGKVIELIENTVLAQVDGVTTELLVPARLYSGRVLIPLRFVAETFEKTVNWEQVEMTRTAVVY